MRAISAVAGVSAAWADASETKAALMRQRLRAQAEAAPAANAAGLQNPPRPASAGTPAAPEAEAQRPPTDEGPSTLVFAQQHAGSAAGEAPVDARLIADPPFDPLDHNLDGQISSQEKLSAAVQEMFEALDKKAAGSVASGTVDARA